MKLEARPRSRFGAALLALAAALPGACAHELGPEERPDEPSADIYARIAQKSQLMDDLSEMAAGECEVDIFDASVVVRLEPGPRGAPGAGTLRKMSDRITEVTGLAPRAQRIVTHQGRVLFANGAPAPP